MRRKRTLCELCLQTMWAFDEGFSEAVHHCPDCTAFIDGAATLDEYEALCREKLHLRSKKQIEEHRQMWFKYHSDMVRFKNGFVLEECREHLRQHGFPEEEVMRLTS